LWTFRAQDGASSSWADPEEKVVLCTVPVQKSIRGLEYIGAGVVCSEILVPTGQRPTLSNAPTKIYPLTLTFNNLTN
jgi:hypothetical protein